MDYRLKVGLHAAGIVAVLIAGVVLVQQGILYEAALFFIGIGCWLWGVYAWRLLQSELHDTIHIVNRNLAKSGFEFLESKWLNPEASNPTLRYYGRFAGEYLLIDMCHQAPSIYVVDWAWHSVKSNDPIIPILLEAINDTNAEHSNMSVALSDPNDEGDRELYTICSTVLPAYRVDDYLRFVFTQMIDQKKVLLKNMQRERPWTTQKRGPIGFSIQREAESSGSATTEEDKAVAKSHSV